MIEVNTSSPVLPSGSCSPGIGVDDLNDEIILPDVHSILALAFAGNAWAHYLREAVDIVSLYMQGILYLVAHIFAPRLCTEDADLQRNLIDNAETCCLLRKIHRIGRSAADSGGFKVDESLYLERRVARGHRDNGGAYPLGAGMEAEAAR